MEQGHVVGFQIVVALLVGAAVFAGGHYGGSYLHEDEAHKFQIGDRANTTEADHTAALQIAHGFKNTSAYEAMKSNLVGDDAAGAFDTPHPAEKYAPYAAIAGAVTGFLASHEAARVYARKRAAQSSIGRATQRFQKP